MFFDPGGHTRGHPLHVEIEESERGNAGPEDNEILGARDDVRPISTIQLALGRDFYPVGKVRSQRAKGYGLMRSEAFDHLGKMFHGSEIETFRGSAGHHAGAAVTRQCAVCGQRNSLRQRSIALGDDGYLKRAHTPATSSASGCARRTSAHTVSEKRVAR